MRPTELIPEAWRAPAARMAASRTVSGTCFDSERATSSPGGSRR